MAPPIASRSAPSLEEVIYEIRGKKVMLDRDLAALYGVTTGNLNKAVARNASRFPEDFMFQITAEEEHLIFQIGISSGTHGGRRHRPFAFTQEGVAMLSGVLRSPRAIEVHVAIMRAFIRLRALVSRHHELSAVLAEIERRLTRHDYDIASLIEAIRRLAAPPPKRRRRIGYI